MKVKETATQVADTSRRVVGNAEQLVQAAALLTIAGFSYWALQKIEVGQVAYWAVVAALIVVGLRGAVEVIRFLDKH